MGRRIDLCFAGFGENCHLAFNDPPADFETEEPYIVVTLDEACRNQQFGEGWFESLKAVPEQAISMSIRQILKSDLIVLSVPDARKAQAVKDALEGEVTPLHPASILQRHPNTVLFLDPPAASLLKARAEAAMPVSPGLVDLQINGFAGVDFNDPAITPADLDRALEAMLKTGVTHCLPTIITAHPHELVERFRALDDAVAGSRLGPLMCPGYHLEGPFLNPAPGYHGCHPPQAMTAAKPELIAEVERGLSRPILMVTLAAESEGAVALTKNLADAGKIVAIGHSAADFAEVSAAADAGLSLSTHLGNGVPQTLHKLANPIFAQLAEDRLMAELHRRRDPPAPQGAR
jgi:hypothetical protein